MLPPFPVFSIHNVVLAAYSFCSYPGNVFPGFIDAGAFYNKMLLFIKAGTIFSFSSAWQQASQKIAIAVIICVYNLVKSKV